MEHYVTLFDSLFLPQGLALHESLERHAGDYTLWVVCVDERTLDVLSKLQLPHVRPLELAALETDDLLRVKPGRTRGEYCWTLTPFAPKFVFDADASVQRVTYVDADLWLAASPRPLFDEFEASGKAVLITEHAYAPEHDRTHVSGRFCVQFMTFVRHAGEPVRAWWQDRCIEWCFARFEDGKFGDQLYLEDWPQRFGHLVHVLGARSAMQAPWNATRFAPSEAIVFHFHGLRLLRGDQVLASDHYRINHSTAGALYQPYLAALARATARLAGAGHRVAPQIDRPVWLLRLRVLAQQLRLRWRERAMSRFPQL